MCRASTPMASIHFGIVSTAALMADKKPSPSSRCACASQKLKLDGGWGKKKVKIKYALCYATSRGAASQSALSEAPLFGKSLRAALAGKHSPLDVEFC